MTKLSTGQVYAYARGAGFDPASAVVATSIAFAESGGDTDSVGDVALENATWGPSVGLWQVRSLKAELGKGTPRDASRLKDPAFNAKAAYSISGAGKNWQPWTTYKTGANKAFLGAATTAARGGKGDGVSLGDVLDPLGVLHNTGGTSVGAVAGALNPVSGLTDGLATIGHFFAGLVNPAVWLRILQVLAGAGLMLYGANILSHGVVSGFAHDATKIAAVAAVA